MRYSCRVLQCFLPLSYRPVSNGKCNCVLVINRHYNINSVNCKINSAAVPNLKMMKLESSQFKSCITEEVKLIHSLFSSKGHEIRIVGGAVRDLILGIQPQDLDLSTTATPTEMKEIFTEEGIRLINMNGEKHGTITPRINEKNFEITTLRVDVVTNGRHAEVEFTKDWKLDANRRDLTINAMYLGMDGTIYDYFNGIEDLKNKRVAFVGDAASRIQEDYLRILRYFRFYGKVAEVPDNHDKDILCAIEDNAKGLEKISGERIWVELNKIVTGNFAGELLEKIIELGIGPYIGFPNNCNVEEMKRVWDRTKLNNCTLKPMTFFASLFETEEDYTIFCSRVKPSCFERNLGLFVITYRHDLIHKSQIKIYQRLVFTSKLPQKNVHSFVSELLKYKGNMELLKEFEEWVIPKFPINGSLLKNRGFSGKQLGEVMNRLKDIWIDSDFRLSGDELIDQISGFDIQQKPMKKKAHINSKR